MSTLHSITTAQQLAAAGDIGRCELIRGELHMMTPAKNTHGQVTYRLTLLIGMHVEAHRLGSMHAAETGFIIEKNPDTVRAPDAAFIRAGRAPKLDDDGFVVGPPDLAVEVISPSDRATEVDAKTQQWLAAGSQEVWNVQPSHRTVTVFRSDGSARVYYEGDTLDGGDLLPGLSIAVSKIFEQ